MKITFTEDHQSYLSGNEYYPAGAKADLLRGADLVAQGVALTGWGETVFDSHEQREEIASEPSAATEDASERERVDWTQVKGVSVEIAAALHAAGLHTKDDLLTALMQGGIEALTNLAGIGMKRARDLVAFAQRG